MSLKKEHPTGALRFPSEVNSLLTDLCIYANVTYIYVIYIYSTAKFIKMCVFFFCQTFPSPKLAVFRELLMPSVDYATNLQKWLLTFSWLLHS